MNVIINFAPTGMLPTREMTPHVPISVQQIIEEVQQAAEIGITMVHLHARDEATGAPSYKAEVYEHIIAGIRAFSKELIICVSLSGRDFRTFQQRSEVLKLDGDVKPDMGSLTLSSLNFNHQASVNEPDMIKALAAEMQNCGILPELEAFDVGMINYANYLEKKGLLTPPFYFNLIVGNIACAQADMLHLGIMVCDLPANSYWSVGGVGDSQLSMNMLAIAAGGGVRVGLEDNIWFDARRTKLGTNTDFLRRIHNIIEAGERCYMPASELRQKLKLKPGHGCYGRA
jgi:3-keto-5-aminohexanoate cleavage enzyme